jgi:AcrR family transcriptional regulator
MRHGVHADDGILQVDENKCGLFRVELEFCHASSLLKMFQNRGCTRFLWLYNMRMPSISSNPVRVAPQQERSTRRLAGFLDAAAELFVEVGYEAATMTAVAERSGSSIGALYNYFPDKQSIAFTLVNQYSQEVEAHWKPLMEQAEILTHAEFADRFIERITQFVRERPAYLRLLAAPIRFRRDPAARKASRIAIANAFQAKNPSLSREQSLLTANVSLQIVRGMMTLYVEADPKGKVLVVAEFKKVLTLYLGSVLSVGAVLAK